MQYARLAICIFPNIALQVLYTYLYIEVSSIVNSRYVDKRGARREGRGVCVFRGGNVLSVVAIHYLQEEMGKKSTSPVLEYLEPVQQL